MKIHTRYPFQQGGRHFFLRQKRRYGVQLGQNSFRVFLLSMQVETLLPPSGCKWTCTLTIIQNIISIQISSYTLVSILLCEDFTLRVYFLFPSALHRDSCTDNNVRTLTGKLTHLDLNHFKNKCYRKWIKIFLES